MISNNYIKNAGLLALCLLFASCNYGKKTEGSEMQPTKTDKTIFSFFGAPGSGKGTLAEQCVEKLGYQTLSTGALFRQQIAQGTELGKKIESIIKSGKLVPDNITIEVVTLWLKERANSNAPIILDGFPRTKAQTEKLIEILKTVLPEHKLRIIALDLPEQEIVERLSGRRVCENKQCPATYNISMPEIANGKCPKCGSKLIQRPDDKPEVIKERFEVYKKNEKEVLDAYRNAGFKIETLNISKMNPTEVFDSFKKLVS